MKIISTRDELFKGLSTVQKAVPQRTPLSTLDCILIDASGSKISLYATDNEIGIETKIDGTIEEPGRVAINAKMITEFVRSMRSDDIVLESDENYKTKLSYVNTKPLLDVMGKPGDEFNMIPPVEGEADIEVSQYTLKDMISKTIFSVSDNENNRIMTGELFDINNNKIRIISMDGHRISIKSTDLGQDIEDKKIIIPSKALSEINKILTGSMEDKVSIYISSKYGIFTFNETKVFTTLLHGEFFNVDQMLSKDYSTCVKINRQSLLETVGRANLLVKESDKKPTIVEITDGNMQITINTQIAKFDEDIAVEKEGANLRIGFNPKFLIEALRAIDDEVVTMYFDGKISPLFIRNDEETYTYLILPINIMNENY